MKRLFLIACLCLLCGGLTAAQDTPSPWAATYYSPYIFPGEAPLAATAKLTGVRYFTLAFIIAGDGCRASWNGGATLKNQPYLEQEIEQLRAMGGDVAVSFGGAAGDELALACPDAEALAEQYQSVVDAYHLTHLDLDIEGDELDDPESIERRAQALVLLQAQADEPGVPLSLSFTLPVLPTGLTAGGLAVLQSAIDHDVRVDVVNIMTMDYGPDFPPDQMGQNAIDAAKSLVTQLADLYPDRTPEQLWQMIGLTPMIGVNDVQAEVFTLADAEQVTDFALDNGIQRLSMWSLGRDRECVSGQRILSGQCSGVPQDKYAFSAIFNRVNQTEP
ncbi:MAG: chitinase [Anaerolineae bacterium]